MAKVICKGTILKQTIATVLTAVAQITTLNKSGAQTETVESRTLDGDAFVPHTATGYAEGGSVAGELYYDPALAGHQAISDLVGTPADTVWETTYADTGATSQTFTSAGVGFDVTIDPTNLLKASFNLKVTGDPGLPT